MIPAGLHSQKGLIVALTIDQQAQVDALKPKIGEVDLTDEQLWTIIAVSPKQSLNCAAVTVWGSKASAAADLVVVKEGSSTRQLGDLHKQAVSMAEFYKGFCDSENTDAGSPSRRSRTRAIERP